MEESDAIPLHTAWKQCPCCGGAPLHVASNPFQCASCGYTHHFGPCTAVGGIVADSDGKVLLLVRGRDPERGKYGIPGGFVDQRESAEEALAREIYEEVQLRVRDFRFLCSFPNDYHYRGVIVPVTDLFFSVQVDSFDGMQAQVGEIDGWLFCHPGQQELKAMAFESNRRALQLYLNQSAEN